MRKYENVGEKYLLPIEVSIHKSARMIANKIFLLVFLCIPLTAFTCYYIFDSIKHGIENNIPDLIIAVLFFIPFTTFSFTIILPCHIQIDDEKLVFNRILFKKVFYWSEISGLSTCITDRQHKGRSQNIDNLQIMFRKISGKNITLNIGIPRELQINSEMLKNTIWHAYSKYHSECNQGVE